MLMRIRVNHIFAWDEGMLVWGVTESMQWYVDPFIFIAAREQRLLLIVLRKVLETRRDCLLIIWEGIGL